MADDETEQQLDAIPHALHPDQRGENLHPIGPRWSVGSITELYALDVRAIDRGQVACVEGADASWWVLHLGEGEGDKWRRIDNAPSSDDGGSVSLEPLEFVFSAPLAVWVVPHALGYFPSSVVVLDDQGDEVLAHVRRPDRQQVIVSHSAPKTGRVLVR